MLAKQAVYVKTELEIIPWIVNIPNHFQHKINIPFAFQAAN